jgi:hypothetical protein
VLMSGACEGISCVDVRDSLVLMSGLVRGSLVLLLLLMSGILLSCYTFRPGYGPFSRPNRDLYP